MAQIGFATLAVIPSMQGFGSKLTRGISPEMKAAGVTGGKQFAAGAAPEMDRAGKASGKKFGSGIIGAAKGFVAPLAALFAVGAGVSLFKGAIDGASDLNESASKVGVVFGKSSAQIIAASKTSASAMGLSQNAYLGAAGTLGNLLVSLDIAPKKAAGMSTQMVKLAGDMASFNNVSPEEALAAIKSGLTGETEPLKAFGVNMNDATLKAQALKMHLIKTTKEAMSPQTKALAAQALIMAQTGTAQGDFARTSGGLANQQRILAAKFEDVKTKIGAVFLPVVTKVVTFLNENMMPAFKTISSAVSDFWSGFSVGTDELGSSQSKFAVWGAVVYQVFSERVVPAFNRLKGILQSLAVGFMAVGGFLLTHIGLVKIAAVAVGLMTLAVQAHNVAMFISSGRLKAWILQTTIVKTATAVWAAGQWLLNAALTANPIGIVVVAIAALVAGIIWVATKTTWFQTIWKVMTAGLAMAWRWMWNTVLAPIIRFILTGFANITAGIATMLRALGNIPGFGWAKTAADKMDGAARKARDLAKGITDIPANKTVTVGVKTNFSMGTGGANSFGFFSNNKKKDGGQLFGPGSGTSDSIPIWGSKGEFMVNAAQTAKNLPLLHAINNGAPGFKSGGQVGVLPPSVSTRMDEATKAYFSTLQFKPSLMAGAGGSSAGGAGGAARWSSLVIMALTMLGQSASWLPTVLHRMNQESGGNPNAINRWDSNAMAGHPSQGLMQTIPGTFAAYAGAFRGRGITDPFASIYAGLNYALHRYGSLAALMRPGGYANGTASAAPGYAWVGERGPEIVRFRGGEQVTPNHEIKSARRESGKTIILQVDGREMTRVVLDSMDNVLAGGMSRVGVS